ncbi:MAG: F-type H+-transporting ATPase subunit gamma, partial [Actinomycetota bacterium]|nr:F-type H+-transporting ATPase subunit gamma [Actinomycetota bacterium]
MAGQLRDIKRRIISVQSTQKITRAMELIASSRIIKAQQRVQAARPYAEEMRKLMAAVAKNAGNVDHPLLKKPKDSSKVGMIVISSDRGLAGAYNSNVLRAAERNLGDASDSQIFPVGKKAISYFKFRGYDFEESWQGFSERPGIDDAREVARAASQAFSNGDIDEVRLAFTKYESALTQRPQVIRLIPASDLDTDDEGSDEGQRAGYLFEPDPAEILGLLLPRYIEGAVYQGML